MAEAENNTEKVSASDEASASDETGTQETQGYAGITFKQL